MNRYQQRQPNRPVDPAFLHDLALEVERQYRYMDDEKAKAGGEKT